MTKTVPQDSAAALVEHVRKLVKAALDAAVELRRLADVPGMQHFGQDKDLQAIALRCEQGSEQVYSRLDVIETAAKIGNAARAMKSRREEKQPTLTLRENFVPLFNATKCRLCSTSVLGSQEINDHVQEHIRAGEATLDGNARPMIPPQAQRRGPGTFEVINLNKNNPVSAELGELSHGTFDTLEEARGCVSFDKLEYWEIWRGDTIVERNDGED